MTKVLKFPTTGVFKTGATPENMKRVLKDLKVHIPKLFEVAGYDDVHTAVYEQINNPALLKNTSYSRKLLKIIKKHIKPTKELEEWEKNTQKIRAKLYRTVKKKAASPEFLELLGCSVDSFMDYLESRFEEGMTWDNYGSYWHVDHIRPMCSFDMTDLDQQKDCSHFSNLRPLKAKENLEKGKEDRKLSIRKGVRK